MRKFLFAAAFVLAFSQSCAANAQSPPDLSAFQTHGTVIYNGDPSTVSSVMGSIRPAMYKDYFWLDVFLYSFMPTVDDLPDITSGKTTSMDHRQAMLPVPEYNHGRATLHMTLNKDLQPTQLDAGVPGHGCTMADQALQALKASYHIDGNRVSFKLNGSFPCQAFGNEKPDIYQFALDVNAPVYKEQK